MYFSNSPAPLAPNNLTVNYPGMPHNSTTLVVTWDRPSCDRGVLSGYELCYVPTSVGDCVSNVMRVNITGPDTLWYTINDLSINTNYTVEVRGRTGAGLGDPVTAMSSTDEDGKISILIVNDNVASCLFSKLCTPYFPINKFNSHMTVIKFCFTDHMKYLFTYAISYCSKCTICPSILVVYEHQVPYV